MVHVYASIRINAQTYAHETVQMRRPTLLGSSVHAQPSTLSAAQTLALRVVVGGKRQIHLYRLVLVYSVYKQSFVVYTCAQPTLSNTHMHTHHQVPGDWRAFRARLVAQERVGGINETTSMHHDQSAFASRGDRWAHLLAQPEKGCLLIARRSDMRFFNNTVVFLAWHGMYATHTTMCVALCGIAVALTITDAHHLHPQRTRVGALGWYSTAHHLSRSRMQTRWDMLRDALHSSMSMWGDLWRTTHSLHCTHGVSVSKHMRL